MPRRIHPTKRHHLASRHVRPQRRHATTTMPYGPSTCLFSSPTYAHRLLDTTTEMVASAAIGAATPADLVAFAHAALFSPTLSTLDKALKQGFLTNFPGLTQKTLRQYPPQSPAMIKGHLDQTRANQRSTKTRLTRPTRPAHPLHHTSFPINRLQPYRTTTTSRSLAAILATTQPNIVMPLS